MLSRWSRLKTAANKSRDAAPSTTPVVADESAIGLPTEASQLEAPTKVELPNISELTPESDFTPFMQSGVEAVDRNAALKKLFTDPHYNKMDGLDIYIDDYGKPDPIPAAMLKQLMASKFLGLFEEEDRKEVVEVDEAKNGSENELGSANQTLLEPEVTRENPSSLHSGDIQAADAPKERDFLDK
jgi:Protein of unknown function (DUF3306)